MPSVNFNSCFVAFLVGAGVVIALDVLKVQLGVSSTILLGGLGGVVAFIGRAFVK